MKKIAITIAVTLASFTALAQQSAIKNGTWWYTGGKLGWSQFHNTSWYNSSLNNDGPTHKNQLGVGIFGGYQINPNIGFEIGYDILGRIPYKGNNINGAFKSNGFQLSTKISYLDSNNIDVYARLGGMLWHANSSNSIIGNNHGSGISPALAVGAEWEINNNIFTRLEYQWINNIGNNNIIGICPNNSMLSLGIIYRFSQQKFIPTVVNKTLSSSIDKKTRQFNLKSDILFEFNKSILKQNNLRVLDHLYNQLINLNPEDSSIIILGFADRIGSDSYNRMLSERRAQSVAKYLISKGISSNKIFVYGMGKLNSPTNDICNDIKDHSKLINCLAPDRHAIINIKCVKNITS